MTMRLVTAVAAGLILACAAAARPPARAGSRDQPSAAGSPAGYQPCAAEKDTSFRGASYERCVKQEAALSAAVTKRISELAGDPGQAGCLGKDEVTCLATLAQSLAVTTSLVQQTEMVRSVETDINGAAVERIVAFDLFVPPHKRTAPTRAANVHLSIGASGQITRFFITLPSDPLLARTAEDWDGTGVYEFTRAVLGSRCVPEDSADFYRDQAAALAGGSGSSSFEGGPDATLGHAFGARSRICGATVRIGSVSGESAYYGSYGGGTLEFSKEP